MPAKCDSNWFKREIWFADLKRSDVVCGVAGSGSKINQRIFLGWQCLLTAYWFSMWVYRLWLHGQIYDESRIYSDYMTNWNDTLIMMHLLFSLVLIVIHFFHKFDKLNDAAPWYFYVHQLLFEFALVLALIVTTANYGILKEPVGGASDIHGHVMNSVVMGSQLLFLNTPIRIFHVIYGWMLALLYCLNTYIAFKVDERRDQPYLFLKWASGEPDWILDTPSTIAMFTFGIFTVVHLLCYAVSLLKFFIKEKIQTGTVPGRNILDGIDFGNIQRHRKQHC